MEVVLGEKSLRKQGKVQFLILYSRNKTLFFQTFFVNNFLTNNERGLNLLEVTQGDDLDNICQGQDHRRIFPFSTILPKNIIKFR